MHIYEQVIWTDTNCRDIFGASFGDGVSNNCLLAIGVPILAWITILVTKLCYLKAHICERMEAEMTLFVEHGAGEASDSVSLWVSYLCVIFFSLCVDLPKTEIKPRVLEAGADHCYSGFGCSVIVCQGSALLITQSANGFREQTKAMIIAIAIVLEEIKTIQYTVYCTASVTVLTYV